jgi:oxygen-dependent protoporphyrinogen oxidase
MDKPKPHIVIIGGGITGLSAAWELQQHPTVTYSLFEATAHWGGKIATTRVRLPEGDCLIEGGPDSFVTRKPELWELAQALGLSEHLVAPGSETRNMYILENGVPVGVPLSPLKFLGSRILSLAGKLRLFAEPFIPAKRDADDESLHAFVSRRLGPEAAERLVGPVLAGIYNSDPHTQSVLTTAPVMREMEAEFGGLFLGAVGRGMAKARSRRASRAAPPAFVTLAHGAAEIVSAIRQTLTGDVRCNVPAHHIEAHGARYVVVLASGERLFADAVIIATPANNAAQMMHTLAPEAARHLMQIKQNHIGTMTLVYHAADVRLPFPMQGLMIPRREQRAIDAITFPAEKLRSRAPAAYTLVRVFFGGARPALVEMAESELLATVQTELQALLGITAQHVAHRAFQWVSSFPQAAVGHLHTVDTIEAALPPNVYVAGNSFRGIGVPDCVRQGRTAAVRACQALQVVYVN